MFTGIVQGIGIVERIEKKGSMLQYALQFPPHLAQNLQTGASVAIDGICQTIASYEQQLIWFDAVKETLERTTLNFLKKKQTVNLERAAKIGDEIGGHLLSGHIYGVVEIESMQENVYTFKCPLQWTKYLFSKGFIAIDGISLTLGLIDRQKGLFSVHLIPETLIRTTLGKKVKGDLANIEIDPIIQATVETVESYMNK